MKIFLQSFKMIILMTLMTGILYPIIILLIANLTMPWKAQGSLIRRDGHVIGSNLIGQKFSSNRYFWGRPSAVNYETLHSGASNLGPTSAKLQQMIQKRRFKMAQAQGIQDLSLVPIELITASASGIDPHISFSAAYFQLARVAKARSMNSENLKLKIEEMIHNNTDKPIGKFFGVPHVNVLMLNLALDQYEEQK